MQNLNKRLNWDIPKELAPTIRMLADQDGQTPAYWLRKVLEKAVQERLEQDMKTA
ncbi:hypothetical protein NUACC21_74680 [Scytonema sp. NUACC21]